MGVLDRICKLGVKVSNIDSAVRDLDRLTTLVRHRSEVLVSGLTFTDPAVVEAVLVAIKARRETNVALRATLIVELHDACLLIDKPGTVN